MLLNILFFSKNIFSNHENNSSTNNPLKVIPPSPVSNPPLNSSHSGTLQVKSPFSCKTHLYTKIIKELTTVIIGVTFAITGD